MGSPDGVSRRSHRFRRPLALVAGVVAAVTIAGLLPSWWCGRDADAWFRGDPGRVRALAEESVAFEAADDQQRAHGSGGELTGMWGLIAHQMTALGLAQISLAHPEWRDRYAPVATRAAAKTLLPEMRPVFTAAGKKGRRARSRSRARSRRPHRARRPSPWGWPAWSIRPFRPTSPPGRTRSSPPTSGGCSPRRPR
ncbi:hypothetical protein AB0I30_13720 [Nocardia tengchongensis]|uniref:hypothetical protein n=1 Tax=Nocardia tengchongensis TaxID=2055889 RepID=UPI0033DDC756